MPKPDTSMTARAALERAAAELGKMQLFATPFDELREEQKDRLRAQVLAVARSLLTEPASEGMVEAGRKAMAPESFVSHARAIWVWQDMSVALLRELGEM